MSGAPTAPITLVRIDAKLERRVANTLRIAEVTKNESQCVLSSLFPQLTLVPQES